MPGPRIVNTLWTNWTDNRGGQAQTGWTQGNQTPGSLGPYAGVVSAAANLSRAGQDGATLQTRVIVNTSASTGVYDGVRDQAVFLLRNVGSSRLLAIPAPDENIFLPGSDLVDMTNSDVVAFLTQVFAVLGDSYGNPWLSCPGGRRRRVKIGGS
jgi:hypothetical protein